MSEGAQMSHGDEDDKPTVVLDLNALKNQKLKQEEDLANIVSELEFNVTVEPASSFKTPNKKPLKPKGQPRTASKDDFTVILFDFQSDFFRNSIKNFPSGPSYQIATDLSELNKLLKPKTFQIVVFNYDVNPKAVNQLTAQINLKFPSTKTLIMARKISSQKAKIHSQTPSGAHGYYQFPLDQDKILVEFTKLNSPEKK